MSKLSNNPRKQVELEDLLRLKRLERPDDAFWNSFQAELHQKTLNTLVRRDISFASRLMQGWKRWAPLIPVGAAALFVTALYLNQAMLTPSRDTGVMELAVAIPTTEELLPQAAEMEDFDTSRSTARFVLSALSTRDGNSDRGFTEVHASNHFQAGFNSRVQFVSGGLATATTGNHSAASIY